MKKIIETCASAIIYYQNRYLVLYDHKYRYYVLVQGHQEQGESLKQTILREAKEETGFLNYKYLKKLGKFQYTFQRNRTVVTKVINCFLIRLVDNEKGRINKLKHENFSSHFLCFNNARSLLKWDKDRQYLVKSQDYKKSLLD